MDVKIMFTIISLITMAMAMPNEAPKPLFDAIFEPVLGEVGTIKFVEKQVNTIGGQINANIDFIHDTDHGVRICNEDQPENQGVCFTAGKCGDLGGVDVGFCSAPTPKTTCCKFSRTCGGSSHETVTYFKTDPFETSENCELEVEVRLGACQVRVDFLEFDLPPPLAPSGICAPNNSLEVVHPNLTPFEFGAGNSFFCGMNTGNHFYLPVITEGEKLKFRFRRASETGPYFYHLRITQVDCRSGLPEMRALRAPDGCLQYYNAPKGALATFNYDGTSSLHPGHSYSICFDSEPKNCALVLKSADFNWPESGTCATRSGEECQCGPEGYVDLQEAEDSQGNLLAGSRFCGKDLPFPGEVLVTRARPFVFRVKTGLGGLHSQGQGHGQHGGQGQVHTGMLLGYNLLQGQECEG